MNYVNHDQIDFVSFLCFLLIFLYFFAYRKMSTDSSAKCYQNNKEIL